MIQLYAANGALSKLILIHFNSIIAGRLVESWPVLKRFFEFCLVWV